MLGNGGRIGDRRIVSEAMLSEVVSTQVPINSTLSYALGWATYDVERPAAWWNTTAGRKGISALVSFIPGRRVGFVFLANASPNFMTTIGNAGKLLWPLILDVTPASRLRPRRAQDHTPRRNRAARRAP